MIALGFQGPCSSSFFLPPSNIPAAIPRPAAGKSGRDLNCAPIDGFGAGAGAVVGFSLGLVLGFVLGFVEGLVVGFGVGLGVGFGVGLGVGRG